LGIFEGADKVPAHETTESDLPPELKILVTPGWDDYALLDTGNGRKLERFGKLKLVRPEPQALWRPVLPDDEWNKADAFFDAKPNDARGGEDDDNWGRWRYPRPLAPEWRVTFERATMLCRFSAFRHVGLFPEQAPHWIWMREQAAALGVERPKLLNLFAYTGAASLVAAAAGFEVTHVDASKKAIAWAKENQAASGLGTAPVRWICDDATKFVAREVRRGNRYQAILLDPPKFGRGPANETWRIEDGLAPMLADCARLLADGPSFLMLTAYAIRLSGLSLLEAARDAMKGIVGGRFEAGELAVAQRGGERHLSTSLYVRWTSDGLKP
jgi:23S rRNA (cytosine1962-C5)-methyltransferase